MSTTHRIRLILVTTLVSAGCGARDDATGADVTGAVESSVGPTDTGDAAPGTDGADSGASVTTGADTTDSAASSSTTATTDDGTSTGEAPSGNASAWIIEHFADAPTVTGEFDGRTAIETPALVLDASGTNGKYAFDVREEEAPVLAEVGFVNVTVVDLVSEDSFGAAISTGYAPGTIAYLANVYIEPNWPAWESYDTTNYDGIVLDDSAAFYAEDLTIANWNADCAIDIKSPIAQFVRLETSGGGNRTLRIWGSGPHYLVESSVNNPDGTILWFSDCASVTLNVYASTFNGEAEVPAGAIDCDQGDAPTIVYLDTDPRTTGEMHPMFSAG